MLWQTVQDALEAWFREDTVLAALLTHKQGDTDVVDIAQGSTPEKLPPCMRIHRGPQGATPLTTRRYDDLPAQIVVLIDLHAQDSVIRDDALSAKAAWGALAQLERATLDSLAKFFAPSRNLTAILGAPFAAEVAAITPTGEAYYPAVASRITLMLNKE